MTIKIWAASTKGPRDENQDCILVNGWMNVGDAEYYQEINEQNQRNPTLVAIFDGMGGYTGGALASHTAALTIALEQPRNELELQQAVNHANTELLELAASNPRYAQMGSTFTGALISESSLTIAHVGDSPAYRFMHGVLAQIIELDRVPNPANPTHFMLTQAIGRNTIDCRPETFPLNSPTTLILCSDGVSDVLNEENLTELIRMSEPAKAIVKATLLTGATDNVSVVIVEKSLRNGF